MCTKCDELQQTLDKCDELQQTLDKVMDALCPAALGNDVAFYRQVAERQEQHTFNEAKLCQLLGKKSSQAIMIEHQRYLAALDALNGNGGGDE